MKRIAMAVMLAGLLLLLAPSTVNAASGIIVVDRTGDGEWTNNTWQIEIFPGETKSTTLTLYNSSSSSLDVVVSITPGSLDNGNLTFWSDRTDFVIPRRSYDNITLTVEANNNTTPGIYTAELEIKSEVPPAPSKPEPSRPTVVEPEEEEPVVPEPVEPTEPTVPEPEEPTEPEELEVIEPEEEEPEEEPGKPELIFEEEPCRWGLLDSILAGLVLVALGLDIWQWQRRR